MFPIVCSLAQGLGTHEIFVTAALQRSHATREQLRAAQANGFRHKLVQRVAALRVTKNDCETHEGITPHRSACRRDPSHLSRAMLGRALAVDLIDEHKTLHPAQASSTTSRQTQSALLSSNLLWCGALRSVRCVVGSADGVVLHRRLRRRSGSSPRCTSPQKRAC
jgi:hypothetical protein